MYMNLKETACFGVAGNFTGHLEQAGEAKEFAQVKTAEASAPKGVFPTYLPKADVAFAAFATSVPAFLNVFPFSSDKIIFPKGEEKVQFEPECAVVFDANWQDGKIISLGARSFAASNDCTIRKEGCKKISMKKNWGSNSKGFADNCIEIDSFDSDGILNDYRIASFLVREGKAFAYGEDSAVSGYSYIWKKLTDWLIAKFNTQEDEFNLENIGAYLNSCGCPKKIMVSIGATRYTDFGEHNFLQDGDGIVIVLYPSSKYSAEKIQDMVSSGEEFGSDVSVLKQTVVI
ncbi:MAG: hypothetical protein J5817_07225 [Treponema sp.]|nr:hypothetical protein [Treponema sp.]